MNQTLATPCLVPPVELSSQTVERYVDWAATRWVDPRLPATTERFGDLMVMTLGLAGETGEVAEVLWTWTVEDTCPEKNLVKELGDVFYYWARLCHELQWSADPALLHPAPVALPGRHAPPLLATLSLVKAAGQVTEVMKKYVRDGALNAGKLDTAMNAVFSSWRALCSLCGLDWQDVLEQNQAKIEGRAARGTTRGSGDDR